MTEIKGHCVYTDYAAQQVDDFYPVFETFLNTIKPVRILEIGTAQGGFISAVADIMKTIQPCQIRSYDIYEQHWYKDIAKGRGVDIRIENMFNETYTELKPNYASQMTEFIQGQGTTLVLCDGGNKIGEFNALSDFLKPGDFIMAHDYAPNREYFEEHIQDKIWNWLEIEDSYIQEAVERNNLKPFMKQEFDQIVWVCKVKE